MKKLTTYYKFHISGISNKTELKVWGKAQRKAASAVSLIGKKYRG